MDDEITDEESLKLYQDIVKYLDYLADSILKEEAVADETTII